MNLQYEDAGDSIYVSTSTDWRVGKSRGCIVSTVQDAGVCWVNERFDDERCAGNKCREGEQRQDSANAVARVIPFGVQ